MSVITYLGRTAVRVDLCDRVRDHAAAAAVQLDEADAALDEAARQQTVGAEFLRLRLVDPVQLPRRVRLLGEIDRLRRGRLHPVRELVGLQPRIELAVAAVRRVEAR